MSKILALPKFRNGAQMFQNANKTQGTINISSKRVKGLFVPKQKMYIGGDEIMLLLFDYKQGRIIKLNIVPIQTTAKNTFVHVIHS